MTTEALEAIATFSVAWTEAKAREAEAERVYREAATVREAAQAALHGVVTRACAESKPVAVATHTGPALAEVQEQRDRYRAEGDHLRVSLTEKHNKLWDAERKLETLTAELAGVRAALEDSHGRADRLAAELMTSAASPAEAKSATADDGDVDSLPSDLGTQTTILDWFADVIEEPQVYRDDKEHVPAGERHGNSPAEEVPTWRKMPIAETGWEETLDPDVWSAIMSAPATPEIHTAGDLADALLAGENFGLVALELNDVYGLVEQISSDDETPIKFPGGEPQIETGPAKPKAAQPVTHLNDLTDFPAAVADLLFPKGISTVETLVERMAEECAHVADMPLVNRLNTFFVRLGCRMSQAQHAARAMVAHLEPAAPVSAAESQEPKRFIVEQSNEPFNPEVPDEPAWLVVDTASDGKKASVRYIDEYPSEEEAKAAAVLYEEKAKAETVKEEPKPKAKRVRKAAAKV